MTTLVLSIFNGSSSFLQIRKTTLKSCMSLSIVKMSFSIMELSALEHLKTCVTTLVPSFLIGSSFFQVIRTTIKAWMSLDFK